MSEFGDDNSGKLERFDRLFCFELQIIHQTLFVDFFIKETRQLHYEQPCCVNSNSTFNSWLSGLRGLHTHTPVCSLEEIKPTRARINSDSTLTVAKATSTLCTVTSNKKI